MKFTLITIFILFILSSTDAQVIDSIKNNKADTSIYTSVEKNPTFPNGIRAFNVYFAQNIHYPEKDLQNQLEGIVHVTFVVEKDGSLTNIKVLTGLSPDIDNEATRVTYKSPRWQPGLQNGKTVRVQYNLDENFKIPFDSLKIFSVVEHDPTFIGGMKKFYEYVNQNLKYPTEALKNHIQGVVMVYFIVEKDGSFSDIRIHQSLSTETDAEALRLIKNCPKWFPGDQDGRLARVAYDLPIVFELPKSIGKK